TITTRRRRRRCLSARNGTPRDEGAPPPAPRLLSRRLSFRRTRRFPGAAEPATSATAAVGGPRPFRPRGAGRGATGPYRRRCRGGGTMVAPPRSRSRSPCLCLTTT
ncbi:unnamed protein product, partial [Ectocarpus sp. 12 AP-2014]